MASKSHHNEFQQAFNAALRLLSRRDHSSHELAQKLKARKHRESIIDSVLAECERLDYLNDARTAGIFVRQLYRKGFGMRHIRAVLRRKGLQGDPVEDMLRAAAVEFDEQKVAESLYLKKKKAFDRESDFSKRKQKAYRFLLSRGFSDADIRQVIAKFNKQVP